MKNVVITGSTRGIGFSMAREFLQAGCNVTLSGRGETLAGENSKELSPFEGHYTYKQCNVQEKVSLQNLWDASLLANPKTVVNTRYAKKEIKDQIIRCDQLVGYIKKLNKESKEAQDSDKALYARAERFLNLHTPNTKDYTKKYGVAIEKVEAAATTETVETVNEPSSSEILEETPLYKALRQYRYEKSREEKVKPYFLFNNAQMEELIKRRPRTPDELKEISGFGDVKCQKYGADILSIIDKH